MLKMQSSKTTTRDFHDSGTPAIQILSWTHTCVAELVFVRPLVDVTTCMGFSEKNDQFTLLNSKRAPTLSTLTLSLPRVLIAILFSDRYATRKRHRGEG